MGLKTKRAGLPELDGIFISSATVIGAEVEYNAPVIPMFPDSKKDIVVRLKLDIGRSFQPQMSFAGNFKKDEVSGAIIDWGGAFVVNDLFVRLGCEGEIDENGKIPAKWLDDILGKTFLRLSYVRGHNPKTGKIAYSDWPQIATVEEGADYLRRRFISAVEKKRIRNYHPEALVTVPTTDDSV